MNSHEDEVKGVLCESTLEKLDECFGLPAFFFWRTFLFFGFVWRTTVPQLKHKCRVPVNGELWSAYWNNCACGHHTDTKQLSPIPMM